MQTHWHALSLSLRRPTNTERNEERIRADTASGASLWKKRKANKIHVNTPTEMNEEWGMRRAVRVTMGREPEVWEWAQA